MKKLIKLKILLFILLILPGSWIASQTLPIDTIPPIRLSIEPDGIWYDFHEKRIYNLNKKMQLYKAIEKSYVEALAVRDQALYNKVYADSIALAQQIELNTIKRLVSDKNSTILNLRIDLQQEKDRSEALVLKAKQKRKTHIKWFSSSATLTIIAIAAFVLK